jgi:hypothetical protein
MSKVQAILFDKDYWNVKLIVDFLHEHKFKPIKKMHITDQYYRIRIRNPLKTKRYRTKEIMPGLKFIIEYSN